jgi:hypothetical protein
MWHDEPLYAPLEWIQPQTRDHAAATPLNYFAYKYILGFAFAYVTWLRLWISSGRIALWLSRRRLGDCRWRKMVDGPETFTVSHYLLTPLDRNTGKEPGFRNQPVQGVA